LCFKIQCAKLEANILELFCLKEALRRQKKSVLQKIEKKSCHFFEKQKYDFNFF